MADKISFVLYTRYEEQINMLNDEQAGQLMKAIFAYQKTGEVKISDPVVGMLWSVIKQQLDIDNQKYQETCVKRKEAGSKGGKSKNSKSEVKEANQANASFAKQCEANQADNDIEYEYDLESDIDNNKTNSGDGGRGRTHARELEPQDNQAMSLEVGAVKTADNHPTHGLNIIQYGDYPTTGTELQQVKAFTAKLFKQYRRKGACEADIQRVFDFVYYRQELSNGQAIAVFDQQKAALLEYAFEQAAASGSTSWRYIDGIYRNFVERGIKTLEQAKEYEFKWQRGDERARF